MTVSSVVRFVSGGERGIADGDLAYDIYMSLKHIDLDSALRRVAERPIKEAMREGKFDNLAGAGQPLELEPMPAEENARLTWWCLRILRNNDYTGGKGGPEEKGSRAGYGQRRAPFRCSAWLGARTCLLYGSVSPSLLDG